MKQSNIPKNRFCKVCNGTSRQTAKELKDHARLERMAKRLGIILPDPAIIIPKHNAGVSYGHKS